MARGATEQSVGSGELLTPDQARELIRAASGRAPTGIRNRALITVLYRAGLRPNEALSLTPGDVDLEAGTITVAGTGTRAGRLAAIDPGAGQVVGRWMERRTRLDLAEAEHLFCTLRGQPLHASYLRELLPRLAQRAGVEQRVHAMGLRYQCAAELASEGVPTEVIEAQLGVVPPGPARRYMPPVTPQDLVAHIRAREWSL
jgi:integrase/recombinase XerD